MKTTTIKKTIPVHIRWMIRRDLPAVLAIEAAGNDHPWDEARILRALGHRDCIGMVAKHGDRTVGHMFYRHRRRRLGLVALTVDPAFRRRGIGAQMIFHLISKLDAGGRTAIRAMVRETDLGALLFLRRQRFLAVDLDRGRYDDGDVDGITMRYDLATEEPTP